MSEHNQATNQIAKLPDSIKVSQAIAILSDMEAEAKFLSKLIKEQTTELRGHIQRINKLRMMLEAK